MGGRPTPKIKDVAALAGVSTATVSRALSKPSSVAEATRQAVVDAARKTGYRINHSARNLRRKTAGAIYVLVPDIGNPYFSEILAGITHAMSSTGISILIFDTKSHNSHPSNVLDYLNESRGDGVLALGGDLPNLLSQMVDLEALGMPVVFACELVPDMSYSLVCADSDEGTRMAIRHLIDLGHRRIGHVRGLENNLLSDTRHHAFLDELGKLGCQARSDWIFNGDFSIASGAAAANTWLALDDRPSAVFCTSDLMAMGFISRVSENGVRVPEDVSVIGFDDIEIASHFIPTLTTIRQPRHEIGQAAAKLLLDRLNESGGDTQPSHIVMPVELIVRQSTSAPAC